MSDPPKDIILEALLLRHWALNALARSGKSPLSPRPPECRVAAWNLMLRVERCALVILHGLNSDVPLVSPTEMHVLRTYAVRELQAVITAKQQFYEIGELARIRGWHLIVLKGGRLALQGSGFVDLSDVDLLCPSHYAASVREALLNVGYREEGRSLSYHLAPLVRNGSLPVELHLSLPGVEPAHDVWNQLEPSPSASGLYVLNPANHLWHVLVHCVEQHPERRGRLRDVWVLAAAIKDCTEQDLVEVRRRIASHLYRQPLTALFDMALQASAGELPTDSFQHMAAAAYLWTQVISRIPLPQSVLGFACIVAFASMGRVPGGRRVGDKIGFERPSGILVFRKLQMIAPNIGYHVRHLTRSFAIWALQPIEFVLTRWARRLCSRIDSKRSG